MTAPQYPPLSGYHLLVELQTQGKRHDQILGEKFGGHRLEKGRLGFPSTPWQAYQVIWVPCYFLSKKAHTSMCRKQRDGLDYFRNPLQIRKVSVDLHTHTMVAQGLYGHIVLHTCTPPQPGGPGHRTAGILGTPTSAKHTKHLQRGRCMTVQLLAEDQISPAGLWSAPWGGNCDSLDLLPGDSSPSHEMLPWEAISRISGC